jgi:N-acetylglutamate synthase-like GNAT family acetyltransferase
MIRITRLARTDIKRIGEIDRSEHVTVSYIVCKGELHAEAVDWHVPRWFTLGHGDHHVQTLIEKNLPVLEQHDGVMFGALERGLLVGIAILRPKLQDDMAELSFLHVSRNYRRRGIATRLVSKVFALAKEHGTRRIYASATPSGSAVGFYLSQGFRLADKVHPDLFALEPEDIHMIREL